MKRVAILGPESTGKSTLSAALAAHYDTRWVPEYARAYLEALPRTYQESDLIHLAKGQLHTEQETAREAKDWLFCDTELTVLKIWSEHSYGRVHPWLLKRWRQQQYHHYLLTYIDTPWEADPLREHPHLRQYLFDWYYAELTLRGWPFTVLEGSHPDRVQQAIAVLSK